MQLAQRGARVACVATKAENCAETVAECNQANATDGGEALAFGVDVANSDDVSALVKDIAKQFGALDILVNNAGVTRDGLILRMSEEDYDRVLDVNLKGTWNFLRAAARPLMKTKGRVVNITSVVGITGNAGQTNYAASKAGVIGMTRSLAKELAGRGVCVNAVAPGFIETDMTADINEAAAAELAKSIALGRIGSAAEIARAVDFLVGPGGDYITGQTLVVDGGLSL
ncbi:MAG: 3-oxoacyl-[acyl-carrier protein] reductase [Planctomycetota bacterium]